MWETFLVACSFVLLDWLLELLWLRRRVRCDIIWYVFCLLVYLNILDFGYTRTLLPMMNWDLFIGFISYNLVFNLSVGLWEIWYVGLQWWIQTYVCWSLLVLLGLDWTGTMLTLFFNMNWCSKSSVYHITAYVSLVHAWCIHCFCLMGCLCVLLCFLHWLVYILLNLVLVCFVGCLALSWIQSMTRVWPCAVSIFFGLSTYLAALEYELALE